MVMTGGKKLFSGACYVLFRNVIQSDEAFAEIVTKITEAATQRETFRAPTCRPSKWSVGAHAWNALQRKRLLLRKSSANNNLQIE